MRGSVAVTRIRIRRSNQSRLRCILCAIAIIAPTSLLVPLDAAAVDRSPLYPRFDRRGFYMGAGGTYQYNVLNSQIEDVLQDEVDDSLLGANARFDLEDSGGIHAIVGYRAMSWFAIELQYEWIDEYEIKGSTDVPVPVSGNLYGIEGHTLTVNTKWIVPTWRIQPYFLLGGGVAISDVSNGNLTDALAALGATGGEIDEGQHATPAGRAGLGLDLYVTRHIVLNLQGSILVTTLKEPDIDDVDDLNYMGFSAGLQYRF